MQRKRIYKADAEIVTNRPNGKEWANHDMLEQILTKFVAYAATGYFLPNRTVVVFVLVIKGLFPPVQILAEKTRANSFGFDFGEKR